LDLSEIVDVLNDLQTLGCDVLTLSGGEALLRKDWEAITKAAGSRGMLVSLISNGFLIDQCVAKKIREAGICLVALSMDGVETTHNYIRNNPKSYKRVLTASAFLGEEKIKVNYITVVTKVNLAELSAVEDTIVGLGGNRWLIQIGSPIGRLKRNSNLVVEPKDLAKIADFIVQAKRRNRIQISVGDNIGYFSHHEPILRASPDRKGFNFFCGCMAGCLGVGVESNGNVKGCLSLQSDVFIEGNVREESLMTIWNKPGNFAYTRGFHLSMLKGHCRECDYGEICRGGCTFMSFGAMGMTHSNPYCLLQVAKDQLIASKPRNQ
jgi:radical SAM protein with 4Fe4S-binding SPASM domain